MSKIFDLAGKTALVTGCKRGIGKAMALALAEAGADIIGVSASLELQDSAIEKEVLALGRKFYAYQCDFGQREATVAFAAKVKTDHPVIDILVNNAGTILRKPIAEHPDEMWDEVIAVNQDAPFILTREIGRDMIARGSGKVIFTASYYHSKVELLYQVMQRVKVQLLHLLRHLQMNGPLKELM